MRNSIKTILMGAGIGFGGLWLFALIMAAASSPAVVLAALASACMSLVFCVLVVAHGIDKLQKGQ